MDGSDIVTHYEPGKKPGVWRPTPPAFAPAIGVGFGKVTPFTMASGAQFELPKPAYFDLRGAEYAADYNEVKSIGGAEAGSAPRSRAKSRASGMNHRREFTSGWPENWSSYGNLIFGRAPDFSLCSTSPARTA
jgi:hypothetical protein